MWQLKCLQSFQVSTGRYHCFGRISLALVKVVKGHSSILVTGDRTECFPGSSAGKESACNAGDPGLIPGLRSSPGEGIGCPLRYSWASLVAQTVKNPLQCRRLGFDPWVGKMPWRRAWQPTPVFLPGESPWARSLAGCSPQDGKQLDMTEWLSTAQHSKRTDSRRV